MHLIHLPRPTHNFIFERIIDLHTGLLYDYHPTRSDKPAFILVSSLHSGAGNNSYNINGPDALALWAYLLNLCAATVQAQPNAYLSQNLPTRPSL